MARRDVLSQVTEFLGRFVAYPTEDARIAHGLWILHTHLMESWESTPRIAFLSPEPGSGKTRALEITELLVPNPVAAINVTVSYLFRKVADTNRPTILFDEADTYFGPKSRSEHEEIRGLINAGHRKGQMVGRTVAKGKNWVTEETPSYGAVAIAGLGDLPDTILARAVVVRMRRRAPDEAVEPYRMRLHRPEGHKLRTKVASWALEATPELNWPELPPQITDRDADVWEPLIAIADVLGGIWPDRARGCAISLLAGVMSAGRESLGLKLLADIRAVFNGHKVLSTQQLVQALIGIEEAPWGDLYGKPLDARGLSRRLGPYEVKSKGVRIGDSTPKGYAAVDFADAWNRYLGPPPEDMPASPIPDEETQGSFDEMGDQGEAPPEAPLETPPKGKGKPINPPADEPPPFEPPPDDVVVF